jgi:DNA-binding NarL/FixJ family response regulator
MTTTSHSAKQVFLVEDSDQIRDHLQAQIAKLPGVKVVGYAVSPQPAIVGILDMQPDVVVLDLNLIGGSGLDVLREVRPKAPGTLFIVLTNHADAQYRKVCMAAGANHFFDKSTQFADVSRVIGEYAARSLH